MPRTTKRNLSERNVMDQVTHLLSLSGLWWHRNNTGAVKLTYKGKVRYVRYGVPGMPDYTVYLPDGRIWWIEAKSSTGTLRPEQQAWMDRAAEHGHLHTLARSVDDVLPTLRPFLGAGYE